MFNNNLKIYKKFFQNIDYYKLANEIQNHKIKLNKIIKSSNIELSKGATLNFVGINYVELNKILRKIYKFQNLYRFFRSKFIINNCSAVTLYPGKDNYQRSTTWHRDVRYYNSMGKTEMLLLVIPVTDVTKKNGATIYKIKKNKKSKIIQPEMRPGDLLISDARILHKGGINLSDEMRTIITICVTPPHIKPVINFSSLIKNPKKMKDYQLQLMGYYSRVPETLFDFFKPESKRFFLKNQMII